jgi:hypothetical protein
MSWNPNGSEPYLPHNLYRKRPSGLKNFIKTVLLVIISAFLGGLLAIKAAPVIYPPDLPQSPISESEPESYL